VPQLLIFACLKIHILSRFLPYPPPVCTSKQALQRSIDFRDTMSTRRSLRHFSDLPANRDAVLNCIKAGLSAPSGANKQPWSFCLIEQPEIKKAIRVAAEKEEYENYRSRMSDAWLKDLEPLGTDHQKPFLETAPFLVAVFKQVYALQGGEKYNHYYVNESVGLAVGIFIAALHHAGLSCLTHTPSPMNFLGEILQRPSNERPYLLLPVGYPAEKATVPDIVRKPLDEVLFIY
jgi:nitroreductase